MADENLQIEITEINVEFDWKANMGVNVPHWLSILGFLLAILFFLLKVAKATIGLTMICLFNPIPPCGPVFTPLLVFSQAICMAAPTIELEGSIFLVLLSAVGERTD